jgi:hypothetical protein
VAGRLPWLRRRLVLGGNPWLRRHPEPDGRLECHDGVRGYQIRVAQQVQPRSIPCFPVPVAAVNGRKPCISNQNRH